MSSLADDLRDGQYYRWQWKDASWGRGDPYWCRSRIAKVNKGRLLDTFWGEDSYDHQIKADEVNLTFLCDQSWPQIKDYEVYYYDPKDVADTRHSNRSSAPIYLRPGAQKSKATMLETLAAREDEADSQIRRAGWAKERIDEARKLIAEGKLDEVRL